MDAVLIGAGSRGRDTYGAYAVAHPERLRIAAVAEPDPVRRAAFARAHDLGPRDTYEDWRALLDGSRRAAVAIVATGDDQHTEPALAALESGHHTLLEKPMALSPEECVRIVAAAERHGCILQIGHVLRYTSFYAAVHRLAVTEARIGEIQAVQMAEHVAHWHFAHSYVRGKWRNRATAAPVLLAKSCHDLDLLAWLCGRACLRVASFGGLWHFGPEHAPAGAPLRCSDGCPAAETCAYFAPRFYGRDVAGWPWNDVSLEPRVDARLRALEDGPYGVCVYRAGNDVCDRQTVLLEFAGGLEATFSLEGFSTRAERTLRIQGDAGELRGHFERGEIELWRHGEREPERVKLAVERGGHGGGDLGLLDHFTRAVSLGDPAAVLASGRSALESHRIGFAAERARLERRIVELEEVPSVD